MLKQEFLDALRRGLAGLPQNDIEEQIGFYSEMIDDRIEEGLSQEEAVAQIGTAEDVIEQIITQTPLTRLVKEKVKPGRRLRAWEIVLLILGSPVWVPLLIAAAAVIAALYLSVWAVIISLWAADFALGASAVGSVITGVVCFAQGHTPAGLGLFGAGVLLSGLTILLFFGCLAASRGVVRLTGLTARGIKSLLIGKEPKNE